MLLLHVIFRRKKNSNIWGGFLRFSQTSLQHTKPESETMAISEPLSPLPYPAVKILAVPMTGQSLLMGS